MAMTDPVADMLTRIRNAVKARHEKVDIPSSNLKANIVGILKKEGYISNFKLIKDGKQGKIRVFLRYVNGDPVIIEMKRLSKPGRRIYCGKEDIPVVRGGLGIAIVSTSKGVMTDAEAKKLGIGGELLCSVW